jgi:glucose-6-phosphate isomerase
MKPIQVNLQYSGIPNEAFHEISIEAKAALKKLYDKKGAGNDFLGWLDYSDNLSNELMDDLLETAEHIKSKADVLLVVGIGGSYLGSKSAIEALAEPFYNETRMSGKKGPRIYFVGHQMSSAYLEALFAHIKGLSVYVNVISKSGTTTEPAVAFRLVKAFMESEYGSDYSTRIIATTDAARGALKKLADAQGYKSYVIPDDVGGRFSIFTPVGLLPIACAGIDIKGLIAGARQASKECSTEDLVSNSALQYAIARNYLYRDGKKTEILVNYEPAIKDVSEWWKQLFGESEGKDNKGILPHAMSFTTDLHSLGQYVQDGERTLFETILWIKKDMASVEVPFDLQDTDGLNFIANKRIHDINEMAMQGTLLAHLEGGVPHILIEINELDAYHLGYLYFFFMVACGISGYILDVNPFDQPGVEAYKKNMFGLLGKPGFESIGEELRKKL